MGYTKDFITFILLFFLNRLLAKVVKGKNLRGYGTLPPEKLQGLHRMCNSFFGKVGLYFAPQAFEEIAEPIVVECSFVFPLADGEKNMWQMNVLISLQAYTTLHVDNARPMFLKNYLKSFSKIGLKSELYYSGNSRLHGKLTVGEYYSNGLVKHALFH
jgi:hypothetical protein